MSGLAYPTGEPRPGYRWSRCWRYVNASYDHIVTAQEVRAAILRGGRMLTAGQVVTYKSVQHEEYWAEVHV